MRLLVVPDVHLHADYDHLRMRALGNAVTVWRPDHVLLTGDVGDFVSLLTHGKQRSREGQRFARDLKALEDGLDAFHEPINQFNRRQRASRHAQLKFKQTITKGNHEARGDGHAADHPELDGMFDSIDRAFISRGWDVVGFKETVMIGGFACSHYHTKPDGGFGKPIGGTNIARSLLVEGHMSCIVGHDHHFRHASATRFDGARIHAFVAGCYVHPEYDEDWCRNTRKSWDEGVLLIDGVANGDYSSYRWIKAEEIMRKYGGKQ